MKTIQQNLFTELLSYLSSEFLCIFCTTYIQKQFQSASCSRLGATGVRLVSCLFLFHFEAQVAVVKPLNFVYAVGCVLDS